MHPKWCARCGQRGCKFSTVLKANVAAKRRRSRVSTKCISLLASVINAEELYRRKGAETTYFETHRSSKFSLFVTMSYGRPFPGFMERVLKDRVRSRISRNSPELVSRKTPESHKFGSIKNPYQVRSEFSSSNVSLECFSNRIKYFLLDSVILKRIAASN